MRYWEGDQVPWFKQYRIDWIKESVEIFGQINRENIIRKFNMSTAQASLDLADTLKLYPNLMVYNKSTKHYERIGD